MKTLLTRSKTALIFVLLMLGAIWWNQWSYLLLMLVILGLSVWEYYTLLHGVIEKNHMSSYYPYVGITLGIVLFLISFPPLHVWLSFGMNKSFTSISSLTLLILFSLVPVFVFLILELTAYSKYPFQNVGLNIMGFYYIAVPVCMQNLLVFENDLYQPMPLIGVMSLIWINDAAAYLVGTAIGTHKMFPRISPGKTWEGTWGGITACFITAFLFYRVFQMYTLADWLVIAALVGIFATVGDLAESMLKRSLHIKDTGSIFPGHGGMLDRFDALFFTIPFVSLYLLLFR